MPASKARREIHSAARRYEASPEKQLNSIMKFDPE